LSKKKVKLKKISLKKRGLKEGLGKGQHSTYSKKNTKENGWAREMKKK